ncbi:MAG: prepilin-type N-terminal cleavage/methylation domain-containing protein [Thermodesulfobacteriota bacterium]
MGNWIRLKRKRRVMGGSFFIKSQKGFTLLELMVVVAIASVMLTAMYGLFYSLSRSYTTEEVAADAQQDVRSAMDFMIRDIRMAGLDPTLSDSFGIEQATSSRIRFTMDSDASGSFNGVVDNTNFERITYELNGSQLRQILYEGTGSQSTQTLIDNVTALSFSYLDEDGNAIAIPVAAADLPTVREVLITLTVVLPAGQIGTLTRTLDSRTQCRNLYF